MKSYLPASVSPSLSLPLPQTVSYDEREQSDALFNPQMAGDVAQQQQQQQIMQTRQVGREILPTSLGCCTTSS